MRYDYRCEEHGIIEIIHGMKESRDNRICSICNKVLKPIVSGGSQILFTGRPPWAYNDVLKAASQSENSKNKFIGQKTAISDKRDNSKYKGQKRQIDRSMGVFNAQW